MLNKFLTFIIFIVTRDRQIFIQIQPEQFLEKEIAVTKIFNHRFKVLDLVCVAVTMFLSNTAASVRISSLSHCPDSKRTFTKRLLLEKHIQLMHGVKEVERKSVVESSSMEESTVKDQVIFFILFFIFLLSVQNESH